MTPRELRDNWKLTNYQLACALGKTEQTIKQYMATPGTNSHRNPPLSIKLLCNELDKRWKSEGKPSFELIAA